MNDGERGRTLAHGDRTMTVVRDVDGYVIPMVAGLVATWHRFLSCEDDCVSCLTCGAHYCDGRDADAQPCTGRTDLIHPACGDASSHSLASCQAFDATGQCEHLATNYGCDCNLCQS